MTDASSSSFAFNFISEVHQTQCIQMEYKCFHTTLFTSFFTGHHSRSCVLITKPEQIFFFDRQSVFKSLTVQLSRKRRHCVQCKPGNHKWYPRILHDGKCTALNSKLNLMVKQQCRNFLFSELAVEKYFLGDLDSKDPKRALLYFNVCLWLKLYAAV